MNRSTRRAFERHAADLVAAFDKAGPFPEQEATPPLLADSVRQCLEVCQQVDESEELLPEDEINELGSSALECLSDLGLWAWQLKLDEARAGFEDIALDMTQWIAARGGAITVLEPAVNALARQANATGDIAVLKALHERAAAIIARASAGESAGGETDATQSWTALHINFAVIATRIQEPDRMAAAFDLLESRLPGQCAAFYAEGARKVEQSRYGDPVRQLIGERLAKWTPPR